MAAQKGTVLRLKAQGLGSIGNVVPGRQKLIVSDIL